MSPLEMLIEVVDQGFDRTSWHGPNLRGALRGVTASQAVCRPQANRHSIWEHLLHAAYWKYTVRRRILGEKRGSFPRKGSNWILPQTTTEAAWRNDIQLLQEIHQSMRAAIADVPSTKLFTELPKSKVTYFYLISGVAAHDVYHAGQIQLIKRLMET